MKIDRFYKLRRDFIEKQGHICKSNYRGCPLLYCIAEEFFISGESGYEQTKSDYRGCNLETTFIFLFSYYAGNTVSAAL